MIERAGVDPEAPDRCGPGAGNRLIHEITSCALPDCLLREAEESQLAFSGFAKIELQKPDRLTLVAQDVDLDLRIFQDRAQFPIRHDQARGPKPILADAAEQ